MKNWTIQDIKKVAEKIETSRNRASNLQNPYNVFTAWKMSASMPGTFWYDRSREASIM